MSKRKNLLECIEQFENARRSIQLQLSMGIETPDVDEKLTEKQIVCLQLSAACALKEELEAEKKRLCE